MQQQTAGGPKPASGGEMGKIDSVVAVVDPTSITPQTNDTPLVKNAFNGLSAFGFAFSVLNTWVVLVVGLGSGLASGGPSALLWGFVYAFIGNIASTLSHSEIFAVFPTAGGQYHWAAMISPPSYRAAVSWTTGLMNVISLWLGAATVGYLAATLFISAALVNTSDWAPTAGEQYGIFAAVTLFGPLISLVIGSKVNRILDTGLMILSIVSAVAIFTTLLATAHPKASAAFVFGGTYNSSGWDSMAIAWLLGVLQSAFSFLGFDIVYHISEEMPNPRREGPKVVNMTILVGGISGFMILLAMLFAVNDIEALLGTTYGLPFAQLCLDATGSRAVTTFFLIITALLFMNSARGVCLTAARVLMSLGRDEVLPCSGIFQVVKLGEPIYGLLLSLCVSLVCGLVQLGSTAAFSSLLGSATILFEITYGIPAALILLGGRKRLNNFMPARGFNLGRWGIICNLVACLFVLESCVIYCFPAALPVSAASMNYVIVYSGGFGLILVAIWFGWARGRFPGPSTEKIIALSNGSTSELSLEGENDVDTEI